MTIHCLAVELSELISPFVKPLKVILTKRFVLIRVESLNVKMTSNLNIKQFPVWVVNIPVQILFFLYCIHSSSYSKEDLSFDNFEKLSMIWTLERCIGRVGEGLLHARISSL